MTSWGKVYLGLYGDNVEPGAIGDFIGLPATRVRRAEDDRQPLSPAASAWEFTLGATEADFIDIYEMSTELVVRLAPFQARIAEAVARFGLRAQFQVVLGISQDEGAPMPALGFERPVLDFLAAIGATIDIDTYRHP